MVFVGAQLAWHGLVSRHPHYGGFLFALAWSVLLAWDPDGMGITPTLWLIIGVQIARVALEPVRRVGDFLRPLMAPFWIASSVIAAVLGFAAVAHGFVGFGLSTAQLALILAAVSLTARSLSSGPLALLAALVAYVLVNMPHPNPELLASPWRASLLGLALAVLGSAGVWLHRRRPEVLASPLTPTWLRWPAAPWLYAPAVLIACAVAIFHIARPDLRDNAHHVAVGYIGAVTIGIVAVATRMLSLTYLSGVLLTFSNIHIIRVFAGVWLIKHGLSEVHLVALGMAATLIEGSLIRRLIRRADVDVLVRRSGLAWAAAILLLISAHYLTHPDLASIPAFRFGVSGAMALLASLYFRRAARRPLPGEEPYAKWCDGVQHFGLTMAIWCAALMIPWLRTPVTAIVGLGLPVLYFYARAEIAFQGGGAVERYRNSAAVVGFFVLALYTLRAPTQMVIFPQAPFETSYYHANAPAV
jgi:hypothetical protein